MAWKPPASSCRSARSSPSTPRRRSSTASKRKLPTQCSRGSTERRTSCPQRKRCRSHTRPACRLLKSWDEAVLRPTVGLLNADHLGLQLPAGDMHLLVTVDEHVY